MMIVSACGSLSGSATVVRAVSVIMGAVVGLTFLFGFGNVLSLALRLDVPVWVAPLVAPAVDLSILGLLLGIRHLALTGTSPDVLRPARRLLIFTSAVTVAGEYGKAAFDAVGPLLLIDWAEVGAGLLQVIGAASQIQRSEVVAGERRWPKKYRRSWTTRGVLSLILLGRWPVARRWPCARWRRSWTALDKKIRHIVRPTKDRYLPTRSVFVCGSVLSERVD
jgi:hypothetical protein